MNKIRPFKAYIYNKAKIQDYSRVICPPYDVISQADQKRYYRRHPENLIHILLRKDSGQENKYIAAGKVFRKWLKRDILIRDRLPAIYFYLQQYRLGGAKKTRLGFISLLRLGESKASVFAHENTRKAPREDRFKLLKQVKANLSPIFVIFPDKERIIQRVFQKYLKDSIPLIRLRDDEGTLHSLWRINDIKVLSGIKVSLEDHNFFIADGHHRYEVARNYRDLIRRSKGPGTGQEPYNYILAYLTNTDTSGLSILPIHRLLKLSKEIDFEDFKLRLEEYFDLKEAKDKKHLLFLMGKARKNQHLLGMYRRGRYFLLRLKDIKILDKVMADKPKEYRVLDVSILNSLVFNAILGYDFTQSEALSYSPFAQDLVRKAGRDPLSIAFFLNPVKIEQIMALALKEERMPPKSTYFYPKVLSGLVINKLNGGKS